MSSRSSPARATPAQVRRTLGWSVLDGMLHAVMLGVSESYLGAFAVELGHGNRALAILVTVPPLCGALAQLGAPWLSVMLGSRKRLVVLGALLQALTHLGFMHIAQTSDSSFGALLAVKIAFWTSGMVIGPPWNAWMATLTEGIPRATYFLWRTILCHSALLVSFLASGWFLQAGRESDVYQAFAFLFGLGLTARGFACGILILQVDPEPPLLRSASLLGRLREAARHGPWKLAVAIGCSSLGRMYRFRFSRLTCCASSTLNWTLLPCLRRSASSARP